jgi:hypothetical protein
MRCFVTKMVHQLTRPRLFAAKVKGTVQVKDAERFHIFT